MGLRLSPAAWLVVALCACETSNGVHEPPPAKPAPAARPAVDPACLADPVRRVTLDLEADRDFDRADASYGIGEELFDSGDYQAALEAFARAVQLDPMHGLAQLALAQAHLYTDNDHPKMFSALASAVQLLPRNPRAHMRYASLAADAQETDVAIQHFECAIALKPTTTEARYAIAKQYLKKGRAEDAEKQIRLALETDPKNAQAHVLLGDVLEAKGQPRAAAESVEKAARMIEKSAVLYRRAGGLYEVAGAEAEAARVRRVADQIDPPKEKRDLRPLRKARKKRRRRRR